MPQKAQKKIPIRRCVGCGEGFPKRELVRVVRTALGETALDLTGRMAGRGAYLCRRTACLERAVKRKSLARALNAAIGEDVMRRLALEIAAEAQGGEAAADGGG